MAAKKPGKVTAYVRERESQIAKQMATEEPGKIAPKKEVTFSIHAPHAKEVFVTGSFCAWKKDAHKMSKTLQGMWFKSISLAPGRYEYRFIMDGEWVSDPECKDRVDNPHGTHNSVIEVRL